MSGGATPFWVNMMTTPDDKLVKANPSKVAAKYRIPEDWVRFWLTTWLRRSK